jgi:poly-gamma-glutamate synthesis protein (capsule biosynthesis protein)
MPRLLFAMILVGLSAATRCGTTAAAAPPEVTLAFVGDMMLDDGPGKAIAAGVDPFAGFADVFDDADLVVGNLECVVATCGREEEKSWTFRADPRVIPLLTRYFDAVSVANNHSGDFGKDALAEQCNLLDEARLPYFGGGRDRAEAHRPVILKRHGLRIAFLGYNDFPPRDFEAGEHTPGVAWIDEPTIVAAIRELKQRQKADVVIPFMHWGDEGETQPNRDQMDLARKMIDAGADVIIGAHPHVIQSVGCHRGKPIFYSLGNFVFDDFDDPICYESYVLRLTINREGVVGWDMVGVQIDKQGIPHRMRPSEPASSCCARGSGIAGLPRRFVNALRFLHPLEREIRE